MGMRDHYLTRAAEFHARSRNENEYTTKKLGMNTITWRGSIYVWPNKPSAMSSWTELTRRRVNHS